MGFFKKIFQGVKNIAKNIPVIGNVVSAADAVYSSLKNKKSSKPAASAGAKAGEKIVDAKRWFAWAPNWAIIASGVGILLAIGWMIFGKKKRKRR